MITFKRTRIRYKLIFVCLMLFAFINVYIIHTLVFESGNEPPPEDLSGIVPAHENNGQPKKFNFLSHAYYKILSGLDEVDSFNKLLLLSTTYHHNFSALLATKNPPEGTNPWNTASEWVTTDRILPSGTLPLEFVLEALRNKKILRADVSNKGTQLKLALELEDGQKTLFKPKWYKRGQILVGDVYGGKDRHNGEIAAFHLSRLLDFNRAPIVAGRKVDLITEILPVATLPLKRTFYKQGNDTCFYGVCSYCKPTDGVCAEKSILEGAISLLLPDKLRLLKHRHPWQRSYSNNAAKWEADGNYCSTVRRSKLFRGEAELLDLIETSVFDFLIDNGDRHHYERFDGGKVLLIDNGKSFGNPDVDHLDILAPLLHCCKIRKRVATVLNELRGGALSKLMKRLLQTERRIEPLLTERHLQALDRRLKLVLSAIMFCAQEHGLSEVLVI